MPSPLAKSLLEQTGSPVEMDVCTVTQVTPLLITFRGTTNVPALKVAGLTYSLAQAVVLSSKSSQLLVLPI
jgi:hypothetical protein